MYFGDMLVDIGQNFIDICLILSLLILNFLLKSSRVIGSSFNLLA